MIAGRGGPCAVPLRDLPAMPDSPPPLPGRAAAPALPALPPGSRVLVAGCGDLGMRVARRLSEAGTQAWCLRRNPPAGAAPLRWIAADLAQPGGLAGLPRGITHLAYLPAPDARTQDAYRAVFAGGLARLLDAMDAAALQRVVFVSSSAVYGEHHGDWVDEDTLPSPLGPNGAVLLETETWLAAQGLPAVVLRLAGLYGPGRMQWVRRLLEGRARAPVEPPHWSNRIHADDAAAAVAHLLGLPRPAPLYLGTDDTPLPLHERLGHLAALLGAPEVACGPPPPGVGSKRLRNARLRASGLALRWPDAREGHAALLAPGT